LRRGFGTTQKEGVHYLFFLSLLTKETTMFRNYWPETTLADDFKAAVFEFIGTTVFLLLAFGGTQGSHEVVGSDLERSLYIATAFGLSLLVSAWFFFRATGGLFNPEVSLTLLLVGGIRPMRFVLYCIAQLIGAIAAAAVVLGLTPGKLAYKYVLISFSFPFYVFPFSLIFPPCAYR
jgi:glycerol uptake facilitator-like aquaporin